MFKRIQTLLKAWTTKWEDEPAARGAAKMAVGAVLVAEGLFGVGQRLVRSRSMFQGLGASLFGLLVGGIFFMVGHYLVRPSAYPDEVHTVGRVVDVQSDGNGSHTPVMEFRTVEGAAFRFESPIRSSARPLFGEQVQVAYSASDPRNARSTDGMESWFHLVPIGAGIVILTFATFGLLVSLLRIGGGVWLFFSGRAERKSVGADSDFWADLNRLLHPDVQ